MVVVIAVDTPAFQSALGWAWVVACAVGVWVIVALRRELRRARRARSRLEAEQIDLVCKVQALERESAEQLEQLEVLRPMVDTAQWFAWWTQNAAECTRLDPARPDLIRFALAAQLAPNLAVFRGDLHSIAVSPHTAKATALAAQAFVDELNSGTKPWEHFPPRNSLHALHVAYSALLNGWKPFLEGETAPKGESNSPKLVSAREKAQ